MMKRFMNLVRRKTAKMPTSPVSLRPNTMFRRKSASSRGLLVLVFLLLLFFLFRPSQEPQETRRPVKGYSQYKSAKWSRPPKAQVVAFYHAGFDEYGSTAWSWTGQRLVYRGEDPLLGHYNSTDRRVLLQHLQWASAHGISALCIVVPNPNLILSGHLHEMVDSVFNQDSTLNVKVMLMMDTARLVAKESVQMVPLLGKVAKAIASQFFTEKWYFVVRAKPAVSVLTNVKMDKELTRNLRHHFKGFRNPDGTVNKRGAYVVGVDTISLTKPPTKANMESALDDGAFDAFTVSSAFEGHSNNKTTDVHSFMEGPSGLYDSYEGWLGAGNFFPTGFTRVAQKTSGLRGKPMPSTLDDFAEHMDRLVNLVTKAKKPLIFLQSFNNFVEKSEIEPTERFGFDYLDVIRQKVAPWLPSLAGEDPHDAMQYVRIRWSRMSHYRHKLVETGRAPAINSLHRPKSYKIINDLRTPVQFSEKQLQRPLVMARYHIFCNRDYFIENPNRPDDPLLGLYDGARPDVIEQHIQWASGHGVEAFLLGVTAENVDDAIVRLLRVPNLNSIKIAFQLDLGDFNSFNDRAKFDALCHTLSRIANAFFKNPSYLRIDERPVLVLSAAHWSAAEHWQINQMKAAAHNFFGIGAQEIWGRTPLTNIVLGKSLWDAFANIGSYTFNQHTDTNHIIEQDGEFGDAFWGSSGFDEKMELWSKHTHFVPELSARYSNGQPNQPPLFGNGEMLRERLKRLLRMRQPALLGDYNNIFIAASWNHWHQGNTLEPSEQVGFEYLEAIRQELQSNLPKPDQDMNAPRHKLMEARTDLAKVGHRPSARSNHRGTFYPVSNVGSKQPALHIMDYKLHYSPGTSNKLFASTWKNVKDAPFMGHYSTTPSVLATHMRWAIRTGVTAFNVQLNNPNDADILNRLLNTVCFDERYDTRLSFTLSVGRGYFDTSSGTRTSSGVDLGVNMKDKWAKQGAVQALRHIAEFFTMPCWLHVASKPAIVIKAGGDDLTLPFHAVLKEGLGKAYIIHESDEAPLWLHHSVASRGTFSAFTSTNPVVQPEINLWARYDVAGLAQWMPRHAPNDQNYNVSLHTEHEFKTKYDIYSHVRLRKYDLGNFSSDVHARFYSSFNDFEAGNALEPCDAIRFDILAWLQAMIGQGEPYEERGNEGSIVMHWLHNSPYRHRMAENHKQPYPYIDRPPTTSEDAEHIVVMGYYRNALGDFQREINRANLDSHNYRDIIKFPLFRIKGAMGSPGKFGSINVLAVNAHELPINQQQAIFEAAGVHNLVKVAYMLDMRLLGELFVPSSPFLSDPKAINTLRAIRHAIQQLPHVYFRTRKASGNIGDVPVIIYRGATQVTHDMMQELRYHLGDHISIGDVVMNPDHALQEGKPVFDVYTTLSYIGEHHPESKDMNGYLRAAQFEPKIRHWASKTELSFMPSIMPQFRPSKFSSLRKQLSWGGNIHSFQEQINMTKAVDQGNSRFPGGFREMYFINSINDDVSGTHLPTPEIKSVGDPLDDAFWIAEPISNWCSALKAMLPAKRLP